MAIKGEFPVFLVFLLMGISICMISTECPPKENIPHCKCSAKTGLSLEFSCNGKFTSKPIEDYRKIFQENDFDKKRNIQLRFEDFHRESNLPSNVFEGFHITSLYFEQDNVARWADEEGGPAFVGLEDSLEEITFYNSIKRRKNDTALMSFAHLRKLREVDFDFNKIYNFSNDWFGEGPNSLEVLKLVNSGIYLIDDKAFSYLTNLKEIDVAINRVSKVARSMFPNPANYLRKMSFLRNRLTDLPYDIFTNMPALAEVNFRYNMITRLPETIWGPVWSNLEIMNFHDNLLNCDDHIEWMFKVRSPKRLFARCHKPEERRDVYLNALIISKQGKEN